LHFGSHLAFVLFRSATHPTTIHPTASHSMAQRGASSKRSHVCNTVTSVTCTITRAPALAVHQHTFGMTGPHGTFSCNHVKCKPCRTLASPNSLHTAATCCLHPALALFSHVCSTVACTRTLAASPVHRLAFWHDEPRGTFSCNHVEGHVGRSHASPTPLHPAAACRLQFYPQLLHCFRMHGRSTSAFSPATHPTTTQLQSVHAWDHVGSMQRRGSCT
jgi:hypothetical protein